MVSTTQEQSETLELLHDVVAPDAVSWMPQTVGWLVLLVLASAGLAWLAVRWHRRWQANRYRGAALAELARIEEFAREPESRARALMALPTLVKRTALSFAPRIDVAGLYGESWLRFLDSSYGGSGFTRGPGRLVVDVAYLPAERLAAIETDDVSELISLVGHWIRKHHA